jgi:hypothetical protein
MAAMMIAPDQSRTAVRADMAMPCGTAQAAMIVAAHVAVALVSPVAHFYEWDAAGRDAGAD